MSYSVEVSAAPAAEPLTRAETKLHLRVDVTDDDALIDVLIQGAREWVENYCRRSLVERELTLRMDCFPCKFVLPRGPLVSLTSLKYIDQNGTLTDVDSTIYQVDQYAMPPRIALVFGAVWPIPKYGQINAVQAIYQAGYAPSSDSPTDHAANVPAAVKSAMKLMIGHWYENREMVSLANVQALEVPFGARALLAPYETRDYALE